jgi:hypothetical protein
MTSTNSEKNPCGLERAAGGASTGLHQTETLPETAVWQAAQFLRAIDPCAERFEFRTIDDSEDDRKHLRQAYFGSFERYTDLLQEFNDGGAGIFVAINETDGIGRKAENIIRVRAVFVDLDGAPLQPVLDHHIKPHIVVESSPGKFHAYWRVEGVPLDHFEGIQRALADKFHGDSTVHDLPRVMRLPGFLHRKRAPYLTRIIAINDTPTYPGEYFERKPSEPHVSREQAPVTDRELILAIGALRVLPPAMEWDDRNYIGMAMWRATEGHADAFEAWCAWLRRSGRHSEHHARRQWAKYNRYLPRAPKRTVGLGTLILYADNVDPDWRDRLVLDLLNAEVV